MCEHKKDQTSTGAYLDALCLDGLVSVFLPKVLHEAYQIF